MVPVRREIVGDDGRLRVRVFLARGRDVHQPIGSETNVRADVPDEVAQRAPAGRIHVSLLPVGAEAGRDTTTDGSHVTHDVDAERPEVPRQLFDPSAPVLGAHHPTTLKRVINL